MENVNCYIITSQGFFIDYLQSVIDKTEGLSLSGTFHDALIAISSIQSTIGQTLVVLDIDIMESRISPLEIYYRVSNFAKVIFTTAELKHKVTAYKTVNAELIIVPFPPERLLTTIQKLFPNNNFELN